MFEHIGLHVNTTLDGIDNLVKTWKPPLLVVLDHDVTMWQDIRDACPNTVIVGRVVLDHEPDYTQSMDVEFVASWLYDCIRPMAERMDGIVDVWQMDNEPVLGNNADDIDNMKRLCSVTMRWIEKMDPYRPCVGNFSVGNPRLSFWKDFLPALELALKHGGILGLHAYNWPALWEMPNAGNDPIWYCKRHEQVYWGNKHLQSDPNVSPLDYWNGLPQHLKRLPFGLTEFGLDAMVMHLDQGPQGWKGCVNEGMYLNEIDWFSHELQSQMYVLGAALYCACPSNDPKWGTYNMFPSPIDRIAVIANPTYRRTMLCS